MGDYSLHLDALADIERNAREVLRHVGYLRHARGLPFDHFDLLELREELERASARTDVLCRTVRERGEG